jgi:pSer/pThr/pTyr-binding forkhead associated (FHA) protein
MAFLLQVDIISGPGQVTRETFTKDAIVFGRDVAAQIVIVEKTASRRHGELKVEGGRWVLVNHSPNGTYLNSKEVSSKPLPIKEKDRVSIGGTVVFEIVKATVGDEAAAGSAQIPANKPEARSSKPQDPEAAARDSAQKKQRRILMFAGIYAAGLLGLIIFFMTLGSSSGEKTSLLYPKELTYDDIAKNIREPYKLTVTPDARIAKQKLDQASEKYEQLQSLSDRAVYETYLLYKVSLANMSTPEFEKAQDKLRFDEVQNKLIKKVEAAYRESYEKMKAGQFVKADERATNIANTLFPEPNTVIHSNVNEIRRLCIKEIKQRNLR